MAVKVTGWFTTEGFEEEASDVVLAVWFTVCVRGDDALGESDESPLYAAEMVWDPALSEAVEKVAWAVPSSSPVPRVLPPSENVTVPVGIPLEELTAAVKLTDWPKVEGF